MDNRWFKQGCPALMSDGRLFTSYVDSDVVEQFIRKGNNINNSHEYREFLQKNASTLINRERAFYMSQAVCDFSKCDDDCKCTYGCYNPKMD
jgi:hypothetical protein